MDWSESQVATNGCYEQMKESSLRSAVRRTGKWSAGGETKERSRSVTTVAELQTGARRSGDILRMQLVTSARFVERNGHGRAGKGPTAARGAEQTVRWSRHTNHSFNRYVITPHGAKRFSLLFG